MSDILTVAFIAILIVSERDNKRFLRIWAASLFIISMVRDYYL